MRTLLLQLPTSTPGPTAVYGQAWLDTAATEDRPMSTQAPLALLPRPQRREEVVALLPAAALSWHRISLPAGLGRSGVRLQAALVGLLEDRLLQDPAQLHLALPAHWTAGEPTWVAACDKAWLHAHLQALDEAGLSVQRIVPELAPAPQGQRWHALGDETTGWLWCCSADHGVTGCPVTAVGQWPEAWLDKHATVQAEPALATWVQARLQARAELVDPASHWRQALASDWNLAQFELQSRLRAPGWHRLRRTADVVLRHPQWRPARWGLLALLAAQLAGFNAWAWMTRQQWQAQEARWTHLLQKSFPKVTVVVDAPLQMAREVARLRQDAGELGPQDFETMLQALGAALPPDVASPTGLSYENGTLQWPEVVMNDAQRTAFEQALHSQGYRLQQQDKTWRLQVRAQVQEAVR